MTNRGRRSSLLTEVKKFGLLFGLIGIAGAIYLAWTGNPALALGDRRSPGSLR